jgi:CheY-like chemotaxis protein
MGDLQHEGRRVLVVDDNVDFTLLVDLCLRQGGIKVVAAHDGAQALERLGGESFDVVVLDLEMPGMDGCELTRRMRSSGYRGPVIAVSAHAMRTDADRALTAGCNAFYGKPITMTDLLAAVYVYL